MLSIISQNSLAQKIIGQQSITPSDRYHLSAFCNLYDIDGRHYIYNNLTKELLSISDAEYLFLNNNPLEYDEKHEYFFHNWFIISNKNDECTICDKLHEVIRNLADTDDFVTDYTVLTTTACNARCFYCYENGVTKRTMTLDTAKDVAEFILRNAKGRRISIKWFGGEPLCNIHAIDAIADSLTSANAEFVSRMTTNGYLFDDNIIRFVRRRWNLQSVQITLDGTEQVYNKTKNYIHEDDCSPFFRVIRNIFLLLTEGVSVTIRLNVSDDNFNDIRKLILILKDEFAAFQGKLSIYAANLFDLDHKNSAEKNAELFARTRELTEMLGEFATLPTSMQAWRSFNRGCMAQNKHSLVIAPDGQLGRCEHFSEGERMFGSIYSDDYNMESYNMWTKAVRIERCKKCLIYPSCYGVTACPNFDAACLDTQQKERYANLERAIISHIRKNRGENNAGQDC